MTKVSAELNRFLEKNQSLKSLPKSEILSIMTEKGIISREEAADFLKNSAFEKGFKNSIDVIPDWTTQKTEKDFQNDALTFLQNSILTAEQQIEHQDKTEGAISRAVNFVKETFGTENRKSNVENVIESSKNDLKQLKAAAEETPDEFKNKFKKLRGVEFSPENIEFCTQKADELNRFESIKATCDNLKNSLKTSTVNDVSNAGLRDANNAILKTFNALGIKNKNEINEILKDIENSNKDNEYIQKYGGEFRIAKNKKGQYTIYRTDKSGFPAEATMEELQVIANEMKLRLNKAYASAAGIELPENATNTEIEKLVNEKYDSVKSEYETAFKKAYGDKNAQTLAENYIKSQKENTAYIETAVNLASMATMVMGSGIILKGASLLTKTGTGIKTISAATNIASKAAPAVAAIQLSQPVQLAENLTAEEPDWKSYGMSTAQGALWVALGMVSGGIGDKARLLLKQKGLANAVKNSGKSLDEIMNMYKSGAKLPDNIAKSLYKVETIANIQGSGVEFAADILLTYSANKALNGDNISVNDILMSLNGTLIGTAMQKKVAQMSNKEKFTFLQNELAKSHPNLSKSDLELRTNMLVELSELAKSKYGDSLYHTTIQGSDGKPILSEKTEKDARNQAEIINKKAERHEKLIVSYMEDAGLGVDKTSMTHRAKSEQSLYDKIKNAILDEKHPATFDESISSIKDAIGTRTELSDFNYKNHPDIVAMYKTDPKKAVMMAAERQSEEMCEKVKEIIRRQAADENTPIKATRITNYMGKDGIPYFSAKQVAELRDYAAERGIDLNVKDKLTKVRPSGYTALQMNFVTKEGFIYEWQLRGEKINKFAECEHVPYDIRENKDVTGGRKILKNLYAPIETAVKRLDEVQYENYNKYLTAHYEYLRMQELGFESTPPRLEDFGLNDPKLKAENLELLHDLAEKLKKNKIDEPQALRIYAAKTEKKIHIPNK